MLNYVLFWLQVHYLSLLGSKTPGDAVRRVLRTIATNNVWAQYSMKGRKGKKRFEDLEICSVIIRKYYKSCSNTVVILHLCSVSMHIGKHTF